MATKKKRDTKFSDLDFQHTLYLRYYKDTHLKIEQANTKEELEAARKYINSRFDEICEEYQYISVLPKVLETCKTALIKEYQRKQEVI